MAKIIPFKPKGDPQLATAQQLVDLGDQIDDILLRALGKNINPKEVAGVLSHRLGTLMARVEDKDLLWPICERVLKRQADID